MDLKDVNEVSPVKVGLITMAAVGGGVAGWEGIKRLFKAPGQLYDWSVKRSAEKQIADAKAAKKA